MGNFNFSIFVVNLTSYKYEIPSRHPERSFQSIPELTAGTLVIQVVWTTSEWTEDTCLSPQAVTAASGAKPRCLVGWRVTVNPEASAPRSSVRKRLCARTSGTTMFARKF